MGQSRQTFSRIFSQPQLSTFFADVPADPRPAPEGGAPGRDRSQVRGGRLEATLPPRQEHGARRFRGVPQVKNFGVTHIQ